MLYGPVFGAVAVLLTAVTTNLVLLGGTRILEGASGAASVPSILGFIAMATAGNEVLRGKASAGFEAATLAGLGGGAIVGVKLFEIVGPVAFFFNAEPCTASRSSSTGSACRGPAGESRGRRRASTCG